MTNLPFKRVLALSAHTDDLEFGCGASVHRFLTEGAEVFSAVFSICEESVPDGLPKDILKTEMYKAAEQLEIDKKNIEVFNFPVRKFPRFRQEILEELVKLQKRIQPDLVFCPSSFDIHQDHNVIYREALRAFRFQTLLGYELPWNNIIFNAQGVIEVQKENIEKKAQAIDCYKSQGFRYYANQDFFLTQAHFRGVQNKRKYAEVFEVRRWLY